MSLNVKGEKCAICTSYLFPEDDIVYCPVCGAPHHRDCYNSLGRCGLDSLHGTENQYKSQERSEEKSSAQPNADKTKRCLSCGEPLSDDMRFCSKCGTPVGMSSPFENFSPFAKTVEIKDDTRLDENLTAIEAARLVRVNPFRYIPKFLSLNDDRKTSWNWAAFLMPGMWFGYRKMYSYSIISTAILVMTIIFNVPFSIAINQLPTPDAAVRTVFDMGAYYSQYMDQIGLLPLILSLVGMLISLIVRVVCGIYGDWIYKQHITVAAEKVRSADDTEAAERKYGGTSFLGLMFALLAIEFLPSFISMFFV